MDCCLCDLRNKEVINVADGTRLGFVCDIEIDVTDARLLSIIVPGSGGLFTKSPAVKIPWACIQHIGEDLIIVNMKDTVKKGM